MRLAFKKSRDKYYLQLIDNLGFIHYVGRTNLENLAVCAYELGSNELHSLETRAQKRIANKGFENLEDAVRVYLHAFKYGNSLSPPSEIKGLDNQKFSEKSTHLANRIRVHEMLYTRLREMYQFLSNEQIRFQVQANVRNSSEEDWSQWMEELEKEDEKLVERFLRSRKESTQ